MKGVGRVSAAVGAAVAGAGAAIYFLLPRHGARRRQSAAGVARRQTAHVATIVARSGGRDAQLVASVRDELAGRFGDEPAELGITAHRGVVTLRGEVTRLEAIDAFEEAARSVGGVGDVNNLLRLVSKSRAAL